MLAELSDRGTDALNHLKFDATLPGGLDTKAFKATYSLGEATFRKASTGQAETIELKPDDAARRYLRERVKAGGTVVIVVVPDDDVVAATYFGAGAEKHENRPRLTLEAAPPPM